MVGGEWVRLDAVVASRYLFQGRVESFGLLRSAASRLSGSAARLLFPCALRHVTDPMSHDHLVGEVAFALE
jgi:hypothetical protein